MAKVIILKYTWKVGLFKALPYYSTTLSIGLTERLSKEDNFYDFYLTLKPPDKILKGIAFQIIICFYWILS